MTTTGFKQKSARANVGESEAVKESESAPKQKLNICPSVYMKNDLNRIGGDLMHIIEGPDHECMRDPARWTRGVGF